MPLGVHPPRLNGQDDRPAVARADPRGRGLVGRQVDVIATARQQPVTANIGHETVSRAVVEVLRWLARLQTQIDGNRVALVGANAAAIIAEGVALLIVLGHHTLQ